MTKRTTGEGPNPSGLCECGCGSVTNTAPETGGAYRAGQHYRFITGHNTRSPVEYIVDPDTGCWIWNRHVGRAGYGNANVEGRPVSAHRLYYERFNGLIPAGYDVHHTCKTRSCVNPLHLVAVNSHEHEASVAGLAYWMARALAAEQQLAARDITAPCSVA